MKLLILTIIAALTLISCQSTQKVCEFPESYEIIEVFNDSSMEYDIYIGVGEDTLSNKELYANDGMIAIKPFPFTDAMRELIRHGMLCKFFGHAFSPDGVCMFCGKQMQLESL